MNRVENLALLASEVITLPAAQVGMLPCVRADPLTVTVVAVEVFNRESPEAKVTCVSVGCVELTIVDPLVVISLDILVSRNNDLQSTVLNATRTVQEFCALIQLEKFLHTRLGIRYKLSNTKDRLLSGTRSKLRLAWGRNARQPPTQNQQVNPV